MCDRKNMKDDSMMSRLVERAIEDMKAEKKNELGRILVKANRLGLRVVKGGKQTTSEDVAKAMLKRSFYCD